MTRIVKTTRRSRKNRLRIEFDVDIIDPLKILNPGDDINGILHIHNTSRRWRSKIKQLTFRFYENVSEKMSDGREYIDSIGYTGVKYIKDEHVIIGKKINPAQDLDLPFRVIVPELYHSDLGGKNPTNNWFVVFSIGVTSRLFESFEYNKIIPIQNSDWEPDWLD